MRNLFFFDVDTQKDFMLPSGSLYVPGAERIVPQLRWLFDFAEKNEVNVISSTDAHEENDPEFETFPKHCVRGTDGQRKLDDTLMLHPLTFSNSPVNRNLLDCVNRHRQIIVEKQTIDVFSNPVMERLLRALPSRAVVFGVTTEYCVKCACMGLRSRSVQTVVVSDAVKALSPQTEKEAIEEMRAAGVEFTTLKMLKPLLEAQ